MRCIKSCFKFRGPNKNPMDYYSYYLKYYYYWLYSIYMPPTMTSWLMSIAKKLPNTA